MRTTVKPLLALLLVSFAFVADAEKMPYDRYTNIVERQMFGPLPDDFDPTKSPDKVAKSSEARKADEERAKKEEQLRSNVSFSMINITPDGEVKVGFTDKSKSPPVNYYMGEGEVRDGTWLVKEVDVEEEEMTIENVKEKIEITLTLGGDSSKDANATKKAGAKKGARKKKREIREARQKEEEKQVENLKEKNLLMEAENRELRKRLLESQLGNATEEVVNEHRPAPPPLAMSLVQEEKETKDPEPEVPQEDEVPQENEEGEEHENDDAE